jgi:hypothetical protein
MVLSFALVMMSISTIYNLLYTTYVSAGSKKEINKLLEQRHISVSSSILNLKDEEL